MASIIESGHAKIVANLDRLIQSAVKLGKDYSPSNPELLIEALQNSSANCKKALDSVGAAALVYRTATRQGELAFENISKLVTRIFNTLKASDRNGKSYETAKLYVRKVRGSRATPKRTGEEQKADLESGVNYRVVSASQMSYDNRIENLSMLVKLAASTPAYAPNEADLKVEALTALLENLKLKNAAVISAISDLFKARAFRNDLLYKEATGVVDKAIDAKTYMKGAFGTNSPQYKEVSGLEFRKLVRN